MNKIIDTYIVYTRFSLYAFTGRENIFFEVNCIKVNDRLIGTKFKLKLSNVNHSAECRVIITEVYLFD